MQGDHWSLKSQAVMLMTSRILFGHLFCTIKFLSKSNIKETKNSWKNCCEIIYIELSFQDLIITFKAFDLKHIQIGMHCNFFSRNQHDCQSCWIIGCTPDVEFTSDSHTQLQDVIWIKYISSDVLFTTDSWIQLTDVVQMHYDSNTSH